MMPEMRYGPHTPEIESLYAWLAGADTERVRAVLAADPRPRPDETEAALARHFAAPGLGGAWTAAAEKDRRLVFRDLMTAGVFADDRSLADFRHLVAVGEKVLMHRSELAEDDVRLLLRPFTAAGFELPLREEAR